jgi:hypothetical protein
MPREDVLKHYYFRNTAFGYNSNDTPLNGPHWESGSKNVFTSIKQFCERAPGFNPYEATATVFTGNVVRTYTWETWAGVFYIFANETRTGHSTVWKLQVGTDAAFVSLYDDTTSTDPFDFTVSNNTLYFSNGAQAWAWAGGVTAVRPWGIGTIPMVVSGGGSSKAATYAKGRPYASTAATGITMVVGRQYVYTYGNSTTTHQSSASNPSVTTGAFSNKAVTITGPSSTDSQVDKVHVFATTDGGGGQYFELSNSPTTNGSLKLVTGATNLTPITVSVASHGYSPGDEVEIAGVGGNTAANGTWIVTNVTGGTFDLTSSVGNGNYTTGGTCVKSWSIVDTTTDEQLQSFRAPLGPDLGNDVDPTPHGMNDPPTPAYGPVWYANRIWMFKNNTVYYSGWEEIVEAGLEEECFPPTNKLIFSQRVTGLATNDEFLLVFTAGRIWKISGDTLATFARTPLFKNLGCRNRACIAPYGKSISWFDTSHTIRITDGFQQKELSVDIRPDIASIDPATASMSFYSQGTMHWLCFLDGTGGKMYVYDLDTEQWLPPWEHVGAARSLFWGEIAAGTPALLLGSAGKKVLKLTPSTYSFDGATYASVLKSNSLELVPPDQPARLANPQWITLERNSVALTDVLELRDENSDNGTYVSDFSNNCSVSDPVLTGQLLQTSARATGVVTMYVGASVSGWVAAQSVTVAGVIPASFNGTFTLATVDAVNNKVTWNQAGIDENVTTNGTIYNSTMSMIGPPLRRQSVSLIEEWFGTQQTACKRLSVQFQWAAASTNFILYSFSVGFYEVT